MKKLCIIYLILSCALCNANDAGKLKTMLSELRLLLDWYDNTKTVLDDEIRKHDIEPDEALHMRVAENMHRINRIEEEIEHCIAQLNLLIPQLDKELIKELLLKHHMTDVIPDGL